MSDGASSSSSSQQHLCIVCQNTEYYYHSGATLHALQWCRFLHFLHVLKQSMLGCPNVHIASFACPTLTWFSFCFIFNCVMTAFPTTWFTSSLVVWLLLLDITVLLLFYRFLIFIIVKRKPYKKWVSYFGDRTMIWFCSSCGLSYRYNKKGKI